MIINVCSSLHDACSYYRLISLSKRALVECGTLLGGARSCMGLSIFVSCPSRGGFQAFIIFDGKSLILKQLDSKVVLHPLVNF